MLVSILFILVIGLCIFSVVLYEEIKYQKNINEDYVNDILSKSNIILKKEEIIWYKDQTIDSYKKENEVLRKTLDLNEEINNHLNQLNNEQNKS